MNAASGRPAASTEGSVEGYGGMPPENFEKIKVVDAFWWHFGTKVFLLKFSYIYLLNNVERGIGAYSPENF